MPPEITRERLGFAMARKVKFRFLSKKYDPFKRLYVVWLDRANSEPTGQIERAFNINVIPEGAVDLPNEFLRFPEDKPWLVVPLFEAYARFLKRALNEWEARYKLHLSKLPRDQREEKALELAGPKPMPWELIVLMSRGDPWCLGKTTKRTPAVEQIIGKAPTEEQLRRERLIPKDLRLSPELEALVGKHAIDEPIDPDADPSADPRNFIDEDDDEEGVFTGSGRVDFDENDDEDFDPDAEMQEFLDKETGVDEEDLTGDLDLDDPDLADELEEKVDAKALGGKKVNPRKNRTRPKRED